MARRVAQMYNGNIREAALVQVSMTASWWIGRRPRSKARGRAASTSGTLKLIRKKFSKEALDPLLWPTTFYNLDSQSDYILKFMKS